jgi:sulfite reductase alpha subunit-like flavoprotein
MYKLAPNKACLPLLNPTNKPIIAVACGTCIGPIRSLIYRRIRLLERKDIEPVPVQKISLFLGFMTDPGNKLLIKLVDEATKASTYGFLDLLYLVPSNKEKRRVQDYFGDCADILRRRLIQEGGYVYVCGNENMVREATAKLCDVLGIDAWENMEDRVIQEAF